MHAESNWRLLCARYADHVEILQAVTCDTHATLPTTLWDLPVTALGNHALRQGWPTPENAIPLTLTWGNPGVDAQWDNRKLQSLTLPAQLTRVGDFALCNCSALHTLTLWDTIADWGSCAVMNCTALAHFHLHRTAPRQGVSLAFFARELSWELDVTVTNQAGEMTRLLFPSFEERFEENHLTLRFSYSLAGGGYLYHTVFQDKQLSLRLYDKLFPAFLKKGHDPQSALSIAYYRLRYPLELTEDNAQCYWDYLCANPEETLLFLVDTRDGAGLELVLPQLTQCPDALRSASARSREVNFPQGTALLLEHLHRMAPQRSTLSFDL